MNNLKNPRNVRKDAKELLELLVRRDGLTRTEALELIWEARRQVLYGADPETVLYEHFGLEPDYIFALL